MWIVTTLLIILLFLILLLFIPIDLTFHVEKEETLKSILRVKWLFGLMGKNIGGSKRKSKPKKKKGRRNPRAFLEVLKARDFLPRFLGFISDVSRLMNIRKLKLYLRIGLGDPADTGIFFATAGPTMVFLSRFPSIDIQIEPDFEQESLRCHLQGDLRIIPIKIIKPVILLFFSIATLRVIKMMIKVRRK